MGTTTAPVWITAELLANVSREARESPRRRKNYNLHRMSDPVHRLVNALEPRTYIRPHRHLEPAKAETAIAVSGRIGVVFFDDSGSVTEFREIAPSSANRGVEVPAGAWHTFVALEEGSAFFETKAGPYAPPGPGELATWSPPEGTADAASFERRLVTLFAGA
jgi:cupin fold WbuC family metalloprotein